MKRLGKLALGVLSVATLTASVLAILHRQDISDWLTLRNYEPAPAISALAERTTMSSYGKRLFYVYDPSLLDKAKFNQDCEVTEQTIVLGCYDGIGIYLYDITDPRLSGVEEVTAAHEMLHAAYDRLGTKERERIDRLLEATIRTITDQRIKKLLDSYAAKDQGSLLNEAHSIIGTEVKTIDPELESYYKAYFLNRQAVVAYSDAYEQVFLDIDKQVEAMDADLTLRKAQIDQREASLSSESQGINDWRKRLDALSAEGNTAEYNRQVPEYNKAVDSYNKHLQEVKELISEYNALVAKRNDLALQQNQLVKSLDSKATEL